MGEWSLQSLETGLGTQYPLLIVYNSHLLRISLGIYYLYFKDSWERIPSLLLGFHHAALNKKWIP